MNYYYVQILLSEKVIDFELRRVSITKTRVKPRNCFTKLYFSKIIYLQQVYFNRFFESRASELALIIIIRLVGD